MDNGWIKLHTKFLRSAIWESRDVHLLQLFIYCLLSANWKDKEVVIGNDVIQLKRGQFITGRKSLVRALTMLRHENTNVFKKMEILYYRKLKLLEKLDFLNIKSTNKYSVITIKKYSDYQDNVQQKYNNGTTEVQQKYTTKEDKEYKEYKDILPDGVSLDVKPSTKDSSLKRKRSEKQQVFDRILKHYTEATGATITNYGKQLKAVSSMLRADFTEDQIKKTITHMATKDEWYQDKGFDLMTVSNQIVIYKSQAREKKQHATN